MIRLPPRSTRTDTLFPYTTLFRSDEIKPLVGAFLKLTPRGEMVLDTEYYSEEPVRVGGSGDDGEDDHGDDASGDGSAGSGSSHTPPAPPPEAKIGSASSRERVCPYV